MTANTATPSYWLNWRVLLCAIWVLISIAFASILVSKYEGPCISKRRSRGTGEEPAGILYEDEVWKPCLKGIHPVWLLAFRVFAFFVLLILLILNVAVDGGDIFYFYTQWTFTLITIYFGLGSLLSIYGCYRYHNKVGGVGTDNENIDAEQGIDEAPTNAKNPNESNGAKHLGSNQERCVRQTAGFWGCVFQIVFQMNAGAVMLTDCVFWFIIVPFLEIKDYDLNFCIINMHTVNAIFLLAETALNCLQFPWFRIAYFFLWTVVYVAFQWIVHASFSLWWPYPFPDLSSAFVPLWYALVGLMHIPCFGIFVLVMKMKHNLLSKWFPQSYQCTIHLSQKPNEPAVP
ncbi:Transcription initiation factor TFIID subunit like [Actinidia chinensis var. chinensis]|uniref:Transcription initiation factor TFIID subunit like n=1 Tax=Actinidia chinensis var. chinensis TaxID=1590841 RepID=A0A2R6QGM2_ACTCC|nr:Transcription initiation factor TFIID subunit like [Actinidia chinensis var. chinensis]